VAVGVIEANAVKLVKEVKEVKSAEEMAEGRSAETLLTTLLAFMNATIGPVADIVAALNIEAKVPVGVTLPAAMAEYKEAAEEAEAKAELKEAN
jgi:hypothetical protein